MTTTNDLVAELTAVHEALGYESPYPPPRQIDKSRLPAAIIIPKDAESSTAAAGVLRTTRLFRIEVLIEETSAGDIPNLNDRLDALHAAYFQLPHLDDESSITDTGLSIVPYLGGGDEFWGTVFNITLKTKQPAGG